METTEFIWINGKLIPWNQAKIHILSHALHYGSGVFEGIRFYETPKGPAVFRLKEHIQRLFKSAETLRMQIPYSQENICNAIKQTIKANNIKQGYIRPIIFYGYGKMSLNPEGAQLVTAIAVWPWGKYLGDSAKVCISDYIRIHPKSLHADAKVCGHYINSILTSFEAKQKGFDEALLLDYQGNVAEGPGENIFIIINNKLITPPLNKQILPGITRNSIIQLAKNENLIVEERVIKPEELFAAQELFFTGTAAEITIISQLNDKKFTSNPISEKLKQKFHEIVQGKNPQYENWLDYVK